MTMKIRRLLVANRGEIARRIFRTAHRLGIEPVAVQPQADGRPPSRRPGEAPCGGHDKQ